MAQIMVLDDYEPVTWLYGEMLRRMGHTPICVTDGESALRLLRSRPVDLLVQDLQRPRLDGRELYRLMKDDPRLRHIPILILSGYEHPAVLQEMRVEGYVHKDTSSMNGFCALVDRILGPAPQPPAQRAAGGSAK